MGFRVEVKKQGVLVNAVGADSQESAEAYVAYIAGTGQWGLPERWVKDATQEQIATAIDSREVSAEDEPEVLYTEWLLPAEYTTEISDNAVEDAKEVERKRRLARISFAHRLFVELAMRNVDRLKLGQTTIPEILAAEAKLAEVQRLLGNSTTEIALQKLQVMEIPELPASEKTFFIELIQNYLASEAQ